MTTLREQAAQYEQDAKNSFDRCDTDGFVSQWASGVMAQERRMKADLEDNGGMAEFDVLFDLEGNKQNAKIINGKFGPCWAFMDNDGKFTGQFVSATITAKTLAKKGYVEGVEMAPAKVALTGSGRGLAGATSVRPIVIRVDN